MTLNQTLKLEILIWDERDNIVTKADFDIPAEAKYHLLTDDIPYQDRVFRREYINVDVSFDSKYIKDFDFKTFLRHAVDKWGDDNAKRYDDEDLKGNIYDEDKWRE